MTQSFDIDAYNQMLATTLFQEAVASGHDAGYVFATVFADPAQLKAAEDVLSSPGFSMICYDRVSPWHYPDKAEEAFSKYKRECAEFESSSGAQAKHTGVPVSLVFLDLESASAHVSNINLGHGQSFADHPQMESFVRDIRAYGEHKESEAVPDLTF